ncbi:MAG: MgtC/SapB family protein, partial [Bacilli bacterium]|nr:MgtC/SapB family protein [Bacilli bacterium]
MLLADIVPLDTWGIIIRIGISFLLGGAIGLEREIHGRPAGLRTHILVCTGSCLVMLVSMYGFTELGMTTDPARLAAQVVSGIGFLGAGAIIRDKGGVTGITTAST